MSIHENISKINEKISAAARRAGRNPDDVSLVAVVKYRSLEEIREVHAAGHRKVAFNRIQEARDKIPQLPDDFEWHMIGHLQTNKARFVPPLFGTVHSVDSERVAEALSQAVTRSEDIAGLLNVLLEVNVSGEVSKQGFTPEEIIPVARSIAELKGLRLQGLMTMAPHVDDPEEARPVFRILRELRDRLVFKEIIKSDTPQLSMGMTNDFEVAVEEGATMVRIGTAIFEGLE